MITVIRGSWVVVFNGREHELIRDGVCVVDGDRVVEVGKDYDGPFDRQIGGEGCLVSPGLISTHLHAAYNARDYVYFDQSRPDIAGRNYLNWQAGLEGRDRYEPEVTASARFGLAQCIESGVTTIVEFGAAGDGDAFLNAVEQLGVRVFTGLSFRNATMVSEPDGNIGYRWADVTAKFDRAVEFAEQCASHPSDRIQPILCAGHPDTVAPEILEATASLAHERGWPVTIHAGLHLKEFDRTYRYHRASPYEVLDNVGLLGPNVLLSHAMFHRGHSWSPYAGDDIALMAQRRAVVSHSPVKYAQLGVVMESMQRYHDAGITMTIGTDNGPPDILAEMRQAMFASRIADRSFQSASPRLVYDAATVHAADALGRSDLGRLQAGSAADVVVFDLAKLRFGAVHDPIRSLIEAGNPSDVRWMLIGGDTIIDEGVMVTDDAAELVASARREGAAIWGDVPNWSVGGRAVDEIVPPSYPLK